MPVILAFDIGVKNLAYGIYDSSTNIINALENVNLMADEEPEKVFCSK